MSLAGFQSISNKMSLDAPIRFKPTPPALELNRNTTGKQRVKPKKKKKNYAEFTRSVLTLRTFFVKVNLGGNVNKLAVNLAIVLLNILVIDYKQFLLFGEVCRASEKYL